MLGVVLHAKYLYHCTIRYWYYLFALWLRNKKPVNSADPNPPNITFPADTTHTHIPTTSAYQRSCAPASSISPGADHHPHYRLLLQSRLRPRLLRHRHGGRPPLPLNPCSAHTHTHTHTHESKRVSGCMREWVRGKVRDCVSVCVCFLFCVCVAGGGREGLTCCSNLSCWRGAP